MLSRIHLGIWRAQELAAVLYFTTSSGRAQESMATGIANRWLEKEM
jgi:hypothetical protein